MSTLETGETRGGGSDLFLAGLSELLGCAGFAGDLDISVADVSLEANCPLAATATEGSLGLASVLALVCAGFSLTAVVVVDIGLLNLSCKNAGLVDFNCANSKRRRCGQRRLSRYLRRQVAFAFIDRNLSNRTLVAADRSATPGILKFSL